MNFDLFSVSVPVCLGILSSACIVPILDRLVRKKTYRLYASVLAASIVASLLINVGLHSVFPSDQLLSVLWLKIFPVPFAIGLLVTALVTVRGRKKKIRYGAVAATGTILCLCLTLSLINQGYHYYPTLGSVFGVQAGHSATSQATTVSFNTQHAISTTLEGSLYGSLGVPYRGALKKLLIPGTTSHFKARSGWVYIPAIASSAQNISLPVVVLTAGVPGNPNDWINGGGLVSTLDSFSEAHHGITPYVFVVDDLGSTLNDTECVDSPRGNAETYLTKDVPSYIKAHYNVLHTPQGWGLGGLSMGGMCAIMLTLRHTDTYNTFLDFGGERAPEVGSNIRTVSELFNGSQKAYDAHQPVKLLQERSYKGTGGYFAAGKDDNPVIQTETHELYEAAQTAQLSVLYESLGGQHSFSVWSEAFKDALPWLSNRLTATECDGQCYTHP